MKTNIWYRSYRGELTEVIAVHETPRCIKVSGNNALLQKVSFSGNFKKLYTKDKEEAIKECLEYLSEHYTESLKSFIHWHSLLKQFKIKNVLIKGESSKENKRKNIDRRDYDYPIDLLSD